MAWTQEGKKIGGDPRTDTLCSSRTKTLCSELENVQRPAKIKLLASLGYKPSSERLESLGLLTLEHQRNRGNMICTNIYMGSTILSGRSLRLFVTMQQEETLPRSTNYSLEVRSDKFSQRMVIQHMKRLPEFVVRAPSANSFKSRPDAHWINLASVSTLQFVKTTNELGWIYVPVPRLPISLSMWIMERWTGPSLCL